MNHSFLVIGSLSLAAGAFIRGSNCTWLRGFSWAIGISTSFYNWINQKKKTVYSLALDMGVSPAYRLLKTESLLTIKLFFFFFSTDNSLRSVTNFIIAQLVNYDRKNISGSMNVKLCSLLIIDQFRNCKICCEKICVDSITVFCFQYSISLFNSSSIANVVLFPLVPKTKW